MAGGKARRFDRAFKLAALARMAAGENVSALSRELGVRRKLLYRWRDTVRRDGAEALPCSSWNRRAAAERAGRRAGVYGLIQALRCQVAASLAGIG